MHQKQPVSWWIWGWSVLCRGFSLQGKLLAGFPSAQTILLLTPAFCGPVKRMSWKAYWNFHKEKRPYLEDVFRLLGQHENCFFNASGLYDAFHYFVSAELSRRIANYNKNLGKIQVIWGWWTVSQLHMSAFIKGFSRHPHCPLPTSDAVNSDA